MGMIHHGAKLKFLSTCETRKQVITSKTQGQDKHRIKVTDCHSEREKMGTSLVAQWLGIRLPMEGTWVRALVREDPTSCGATKPMSHNY